MANTNLTVDMITMEAMRVLHNKANMIAAVDRQYDEYFGKSGATGKIGDSLRIRKPKQFAVTTGATLGSQDVTEESETLTVATRKHVPMSFGMDELTLDIDDFSRLNITPAVSRLVAEVEKDGLATYKDIINHVGTPGTTPATALVFLQAGQKLDECLALRDEDRKAIVNPACNSSMIDALKGLYNDSSSLSKQFTKGVLVPSLGLNWSISPIVNTHTCGSRAATGGAVNGASQTGATLAIDGLAASATITYGDKFTIADVYAVNPETKQNYSHLQQFTVTAAATASAGAVTLSISPSIVTSGARQTVSAGPADNAAITFTGTASTAYPQNLVFHKEAITLVTADIMLPKGTHFAARHVFDGVSLRVVQDYNINSDTMPCRIDILYGWKVVRPSLGCVVWG